MKKKICVTAAALSALSLLIIGGIRIIKAKRRARHI
jgi:hypothetical protein